MRLLLVDDDEVLVDALANHLIKQRYAVDIASDGEEAWEYIELFDYALIVLDVMLPKLDGISLCEKLRNHDYSMPVLMLTARDRSTDIVKGLNAGADDYLVKPFNFDVLTARIHALLRRESQSLPSILKRGSLSLNPNNLEVIYDEKLLNLTAKEYALVELFLRSPNRVFTIEGIIESLWTFEEPPTEGAVRTHIKTLRQKLKSAGAAKDLIETVYGIGYRLKPLPNNVEEQTEISASNSETRSDSTADLANLWSQYKDAMSDRLVILENTATTLTTSNINPELKRSAKLAAHKLAGSLGSLGFDDGSKLARELEVLLALETFPQPEQIEPFKQLVSTLRERLELHQPNSSSAFEARPLLLIVDNDRDFTHTLTTAASNFRTAIATTASQAQEIIGRDRPAIILLKIFQIKTDSTLDNYQIDSLDLLAELDRQMPSLPVVAIVPKTALFNTDDDFHQRLKVLRSTEHTLLVQPVTPTQAMDAVTQRLQGLGTGRKIMIVDDDSSILQTMQISLEPWGFEITTLSNPHQFWQVLQATSPDLLVLDIEMPDINGMELCRALRNDLNWSHLPVLFLTAHQDLETQDRAFAIGADDYVSKPVKGAELTTRILNRLSRIRTIRGRFPN
jgi:DNA-binding response OmpR family regulator